MMEMEKLLIHFDVDSSTHRALARSGLPDQKQLLPAVASDVVGHDHLKIKILKVEKFIGVVLSVSCFRNHRLLSTHPAVIVVGLFSPASVVH